VITAHQYNAFSAFCPDGISFKGCCPLPFGCFQQPCCQPAGQPACWEEGCSYPGQLPAPGAGMSGTPPGTAPAAPQQSPQGAAPVENTQSFNMYPGLQPMPFSMMPAPGYQPIYNAGYAPMAGPMIPATMPYGAVPGY
jgi:hypothetical protein